MIAEVSAREITHARDRTRVLFGIAVGASMLFGCTQARAPSSDVKQLEKRPSAEVVGYPDGAWMSSDLNALALSAAQILIAHRDVQASRHFASGRPSQRDRASALQKAQQTHQRLQSHPDEFVGLAARESDDWNTAAYGGDLGVFHASELPLPLTNALGYLKPGEISRVVETELGFHVLKRLPLAPDVPVHFSHIAIKHSAAIGWRRDDRAVPARTRAEARELSLKLAAELKENPANFAAAVREHSDADDVALEGDLGVWERHEHAFQEFSLREAALRLEVGKTSEPIESPSGFHIVKRLPAVTPELRAASVITILHTDSQMQTYNPVARRGKREAAGLASELLQELSKHPGRFEQRRVEYCELAYCDSVNSFYPGRGLPAIESALASLAVGQISPRPVESPLGLLLLRREDPAKVPAPSPAPVRRSFDEPSPPPQEEDPQQTAAQMAEYVLGLGQYAQQKLKLKPAADERFGAVFAELAGKVSQDKEIEVEAELSRLQEQIVALLSAEELERFERHSRAWAALHKSKTARP